MALDAQRQTVEVRGHREARAVALGHAPRGESGSDVLEHARARHALDLPDVGDRTGDRAAGIVGVGHAGDGRSELAAAGVVSLTSDALADRLGVEPGHQHHRLVGELQPLDIGQAVGTVRRGRRRDVSDDGRHAARPVVIDVVGEVAGEHRRVEAAGCRSGSRAR